MGAFSLYIKLGVLFIVSPLYSVIAATVGGFDDGGLTLVSAMMMFLGSEESVYILDKAENNAATINGHPAWGSLWDIKTHTPSPMDIRTNSFCASGMHLPNGSYVTFGGNDAVTTGGAVGSQKNSDNTGAWDLVYQDFDGRRSIRIVNPCKISDNLNSGNCKWFDEPDQLSMKKNRWYSTAEPTGEGRIVIIGGMVTGGYVNRWVPNTDPATENGSAEPTYEFYPARESDGAPQVLNFLVKTSGLNAYVHTFLMASGKMLLQANLSTALWDYTSNTETALPDMPNGVIRVYPASGATALLPLTPANNWTQTLLFCGGSAIADEGWGDYTGPKAETWKIDASQDCRRLTPEPPDGSQPQYEQDDDMLQPRTMSQFIILPTGKLLLINGGQKGTAGYYGAGTPYGYSLAAEPVYTPVLYDPLAPKGSRWSNQNLSQSQIPRLYHSTAILLPDASVLVAGSNPSPDVNLTVVFPTEYRADIFYPPYFSASVRPSPMNLPSTLSYGGQHFNTLIPADSFVGNANDAAAATNVTLVRGGFTTHAMNMGQRFLQLNNTYTVNSNGSIVLHVSQLPPNPNLFQPGPALLFVNINGIPSKGKLLIIGNGAIGAQPQAVVSELPECVPFNGTVKEKDDKSTTPTPKKMFFIAGVVAAVAVAGVLSAFGLAWYLRRRKSKSLSSEKFPLPEIKSEEFDPMNSLPSGIRGSYATDSTGALLLNDRNSGYAGMSTPSFLHEYWDDMGSGSLASFPPPGLETPTGGVAASSSTNLFVGQEYSSGNVSASLQDSTDTLHLPSQAPGYLSLYQRQGSEGGPRAAS